MNKHFAVSRIFSKKLTEKFMEGADVQELNDIIDGFNLRSGPCGTERMQVINYLFKRIIDVFLPTYTKHLFWMSDNNTGSFEKDMNILKER